MRRLILSLLLIGSFATFQTRPVIFETITAAMVAKAVVTWIIARAMVAVVEPVNSVMLPPFQSAPNQSISDVIQAVVNQ